LIDNKNQEQKQFSNTLSSRRPTHVASHLPSRKTWHQGKSSSLEHCQWLLTSQHQQSFDHPSSLGGALFYPKRQHHCKDQQTKATHR